MTAAEAIARARLVLEAVTDTGRLEGELLLAEATGLSRASVLAYPDRGLSESETRRFEAVLTRRKRGEPLAYIVRRREFYSLSLDVSPAVLVPRPETELLVDAVLERVPERGARILDLGTGSGAIAIAIKRARPGLDLAAVDIDLPALEIARANGERLAPRIRWLQSDWFSAVSAEVFDLIVSNPPYVPSRDPHFAGPLEWEPRLALDGGADGLDACRAILDGAARRLVSGGWLLLEHGFDQREAVCGLAARHGLEPEALIDDLAGQPRVVCLRKAEA